MRQLIWILEAKCGPPSRTTDHMLNRVMKSSWVGQLEGRGRDVNTCLLLACGWPEPLACCSSCCCCSSSRSDPSHADHWPSAALQRRGAAGCLRGLTCPVGSPTSTTTSCEKNYKSHVRYGAMRIDMAVCTDSVPWFPGCHTNAQPPPFGMRLRMGFASRICR